MSEKRIDPEDGQAYTWDELSEYYAGKYKKKALAAYWEECTVVKKKGKAKAKTKAEPKGKAKAEPKAKVKAKAKAKSKPRVAGPFKVCVCGGAGGIGQPLSMLMATDPNVKELCVFDLSVAMVPPAGVAADLSHLEKPVKVTGYVMEVGKNPIDHLEECLTGCDLVLIPAGMPRKPGMTRDDLFKVNADIAKGLDEEGRKTKREDREDNSIEAELYKKKELDPSKIVGVTTLDCVRANKFVGEITGKNPKFINIPVIGGHAGITIMPVFSQDKAGASIAADKIPDLDKKVQDAGTEVVNAKGGKGSATLSMAYAGARLGSSILAGLAGRKRVECAYVKSDVSDLPYFTSKVVFGPGGINKILPVGKLNEYEEKRLEEAKAQLKSEIETGIKYAESNNLA